MRRPPTESITKVQSPKQRLVVRYTDLMAGHIGPASFTPFPAGAKQLTSIILHRIKAATSLFFCLFFFPRLRHSSGSSRPLSLEPLGRHANTITPGYLFPSTHTTDQIITLVPFSFLFFSFFEIKFPALAYSVVAHQSIHTIICIRLNR